MVMISEDCAAFICTAESYLMCETEPWCYLLPVGLNTLLLWPENYLILFQNVSWQVWEEMEQILKKN